MNKEIKAKWLAALRSGQYKQATGQLRKPSGFCCLGVLCDVVDPRGWDLGDYYGCRNMPPQTVRELALMESWSIPGLEVLDYDSGPAGIIDYVRLDQLNDEEGLTFDQIADVIEYFY